MKFDAVIILAGGISDQGKLPDSVKSRIRLAKKVFLGQFSKIFLMSGKWSIYWDLLPPRLSESELMKNYAQKIGIPTSSIIIEGHSQNTYENVFYSIKLFVEPQNWKHVLVITSDFHLNRCKKIFSYLNNSECNYYFIGAKNKSGLLKKVRRQIKEFFLLNTQWLFQYFFNS